MVVQVIVSLAWCPITELYGEPSYNMNVRSTGVLYMRNNPERFIKSSADQSWLRYLAYMSQQGVWADAIVIQAVADALNLTIHIIESNPGFALVTYISPVSSGTDTTVITIGHLDEVHYASIVPFNVFQCNLQQSTSTVSNGSL